MKICFIVGAFPNMKCGVGDYTNIIAKELVAKGNDVSIITSKSAKKEKYENFHVFNIMDSWNFKEKESILKILREVQPDVVHIQYPSDMYGKSLFINLLPSMIKKEVQCKIVETVHEYLNYTTKGKIRNLINYYYADQIIVVEKQYIERIKGFIPIISKKLNVKYIPISSNIPKSNITEEGIQNIKKELGIENNIVISYFGFVNELKGIETLIQAVKELVKTKYNIKLMILSELSKENNYQKEILNMIEHLGIEDNIIVTGFIESSEKVADYIKLSNLSVLPFIDGVSERNGSFLAAYNQGTPIVTTADSKKDSQGVYYVKPMDVNGTVNKIIDCLEKNMNLEFNREVLNWDDIVKAHLDIYK
ncbi:glycosyltransferase [Clostridium gasigenes]|uniref:glycosyltransferase n=1 Tax=Clostridium gasigenes TaxID=94869 RepID=UPI001C0ABA65|nr:glycosyltransferase [Clostridium gasigenes]MBU3103155.1 glycosyltransferase [Clostridium gasigenes]